MRDVVKNELVDVASLPERQLTKLMKEVVDFLKQESVPECEFQTHSGEELLKHYGIAELLNHEEHDNTDGYVVYRKDTLEITDLNYRSIRRRLEPEDWNYVCPNIPLLRVEYDPFSNWKEKVQKIERGEVSFTHLNLYRSPGWTHFKVKTPQIPPLIKEYLEFLFPEEESRHFALGWLYNAMVHRSKTYFFIVGGQGAGKTTFANLATRLIGRNNMVPAKEDFLRNQFNDIIENKRLVVLDEFHANTVKETDVLKARIEDTLTLEGKHKDQKVVKNYASFMLINNYFTSVRIDPSAGRKFSVPDITDESILHAKGEDWVRKLNKSIDSDNHIAHLAAYILQEYKDHISPHDYLHTWRYEKVTREAASEGMKTLINMLIDEGYDDPLIVKDVRNQHKKMHRGERFPTNLEIKKFFEDFTWNKSRVGEITYNDDEGALLKRHEDYKAPKL